jgi:signal transduction histidine kinase
VTNLVSNAIEYSRQGDTVRIRLVCRPDHLIFSVEDNGPGMSRQDMGKLFTPFGRQAGRKKQPESRNRTSSFWMWHCRIS